MPAMGMLVTKHAFRVAYEQSAGAYPYPLVGKGAHRDGFDLP